MNVELFGDAVDLALAGESHLRVAETAESAGFELVGIDDQAAAAQMWDAIRTTRHQHREAQHRWTLVGVGTAIQKDVGLAREKSAVLFGAGFHDHPRRVP